MAGIFHTLPAGARTLASLPLPTEHLVVTKRQLLKVPRRREGTWKPGLLNFSSLVPSRRSGRAGPTIESPCLIFSVVRGVWKGSENAVRPEGTQERSRGGLRREEWKTGGRDTIHL